MVTASVLYIVCTCDVCSIREHTFANVQQRESRQSRVHPFPPPRDAITSRLVTDYRSTVRICTGTMPGCLAKYARKGVTVSNSRRIRWSGAEVTAADAVEQLEAAYAEQAAEVARTVCIRVTVATMNAHGVSPERIDQAVTELMARDEAYWLEFYEAMQDSQYTGE